MFYEDKISTKTVNKIIDIIEKNKKTFKDVSKFTYTYKGFQTVNIVNLFDMETRKKILKDNCIFQDIFHIHYIEYNDGGYQKKHNHFNSEVYSFILYLNDAKGDTVFEHKKVSPIKGKILIFDSDMDHFGEKSKNKKILVGAIKKK